MAGPWRFTVRVWYSARQLPAIMAAGREAEIAEMTRAYHRRVQEHGPEGPLDEAQAISSQLVHDRLAELASHFEQAVAIWLDISRAAVNGDRISISIFTVIVRLPQSTACAHFLQSWSPAFSRIESQWSSGPFLIIPIVIVAAFSHLLRIPRQLL